MKIPSSSFRKMFWSIDRKGDPSAAPSAEGRDRVLKAVELARQQEEQGDVEAALNGFASLIAMASEYPELQPAVGGGLARTAFQLLQAFQLNGSSEGHEEAEARLTRHMSDAVDLLTRATAQGETSGQAYLDLANAQYVLGRGKEAAESYRRAIRCMPSELTPKLSLVELLKSFGEFAEGERVLCEHQKDWGTSADVEFRIGYLAQLRGDVGAAIDRYESAARLDPGFVDAYIGAAALYEKLGNRDAAIRNVKCALAQSGASRPQLYVELAKLYKLKGDARTALACLEDAEEAGCQSTEMWGMMSLLYEQEGSSQRALAAAERALTLDPHCEAALVRLSSIRLSEGDMDGAALLAKRALAVDPKSVGAYFTLSAAMRFRGDEPEAEAMENLVHEPALDVRDRSNLAFALAKVRDDSGAHDSAFSMYKLANSLVQPTYRHRKREIYVKRIREHCGADLFRTTELFGSVSERPVFVIGMPRAGTTLVEQILASHPQVAGAGELSDIVDLASEEIASDKGFLVYPESLPRLQKSALTDMAAQYLKRLESVSLDAVKVVDKKPENYFFIGLIRRLFPNARIIHCVRNPMDTCLSCFFQNFTNQNVTYAYDLKSLGHAYGVYVRVMDHWREVFPGEILDVSYETLVDSTEAVARQLIEYCGLPWDDACLRYYETKRDVTTASRWQVRQPIYRTSVGRWRHYEAHLEPLLEELARWGISPEDA